MKKETKIGLIITALVVVFVVILMLREATHQRPGSTPTTTGADQTVLFPVGPEEGMPLIPESAAPPTVAPDELLKLQIGAAPKPEAAVSTAAGAPGEAAAIAPAPAAKSYTVEKGDTLSSIAAKFYGDSSQWRVIYNANRDRIPDEHQLRIGQVLTIPAAGASTAVSSPAPAVSGAPAAETTKAKTYVVQKGDSLYGIAQRFYGDGSQWQKILSANSSKLSAPEELRAGMELVIP